MRRLLLFFLAIILIALGAIAYYKREAIVSSDYLTLYGNVDVRQVDIGFRVMGRVEVMPLQEGDLVEAGTLVGILDKQPYLDEVHQKEAAVESIRLELLNAEKLVKRRQGLVEMGAVSDEELQNTISERDIARARLAEAEAALGVALTNLNDTEAYAPNRGTVLTRIREPGSIVNVSDAIYTISLTDPVWVRAFVAEPDLGKIYPGMPAEIYTDSKGLSPYKGHVGFISPVAEFTPKTVETTQLRTDLVYRLRIIADNPDRGLLQGMPVTVKLFTGKRESP